MLLCVVCAPRRPAGLILQINNGWFFFLHLARNAVPLFFFPRACRHALEVNMRLLNLIVMLKLLALEAILFSWRGVYITYL